METKNISRSGMLLLELLLAILIFALAVSVCVQVFVKAHELSQRAQELADGVNHCTNAAEILRSAESREEGIDLLEQAYPQMHKQEDSVSVDLDANVLDIRWTENAGLDEYIITYQNQTGRQIYELELVCMDKEVLQ